MPINVQSQQHRRLRRHAFTLIELLTVLAIVAVLMGMTVGVVRNTGGQNAAVRTVTQQLYLARQYAINKRQTVYVFFPNDSITGSTNKARYRDYLWKSMMPYVEDTDDLDGSHTTDFVPVHNTDWTFLPKGVGASLEMTSSGTIDEEDNVPLVPIAGGGTPVDGVQCIIFKPSGSLKDPVKDVVITVRKLGKDDKVLTGKLTENETTYSELTVNGLTGRVTVKEVNRTNE